MTRPLRIGLVGIGKIARDQHIPALAASDSFELVATASRHAELPGIPAHHGIEEMLAGGHALDAVSICTPPAGRADIAQAAIAAGLHVMLEKPPGATVCEVLALEQAAADRGVSLFATWHSREAASVDAARDWLAERRIDRVAIEWREDIRVWHPGQEWILDTGGFGVFDPGINALSIATAILPAPLTVAGGVLSVPAGRGSPIAASVEMRHGAAPVSVELDFLQTGPQSWDITVDTDAGRLTLTGGGKRMEVAGHAISDGADAEYPRLYARFAQLCAARARDVDLRPLQLVADAFLLAERRTTAAFDF